MIPHNRPTIGVEEAEAACRVLKSGWLSEGPEVESFENEFCKFIGLPKGHSVAVSSGTAALFLSLWVLNGRGKKIAFPVYVCTAIRNAIGMVNGYESPLDVTKDSPNVDIHQLERIEADIKIIPHTYGIPIDLSGFPSSNVIEDCAQALGAKVNGKSVGLMGSLGIYSFYATKLITSGGQGGMVISKDKNLVDAIRDYREFDYRHDNKDRFNFQMTDLQAAIGREQLRKLPAFLERRTQIFNRYKKAGLEVLDFIPNKTTSLHPARYRAVVKTKNPHEMIDSLAFVGIEAKVPTEDWELLGNHVLFPNAMRLTRETVSLPIYPSLLDEDIDKILSAVGNK